MTWILIHRSRVFNVWMIPQDNVVSGHLPPAAALSVFRGSISISWFDSWWHLPSREPRYAPHPIHVGVAVHAFVRLSAAPHLKNCFRDSASTLPQGWQQSKIVKIVEFGISPLSLRLVGSSKMHGIVCDCGAVAKPSATSIPVRQNPLHSECSAPRRRKTVWSWKARILCSKRSRCKFSFPYLLDCPASHDKRTWAHLIHLSFPEQSTLLLPFIRALESRSFYTLRVGNHACTLRSKTWATYCIAPMGCDKATRPCSSTDALCFHAMFQNKPTREQKFHAPLLWCRDFTALKGPLTKLFASPRARPGHANVWHAPLWYRGETRSTIVREVRRVVIVRATYTLLAPLCLAGPNKNYPTHP